MSTELNIFTLRMLRDQYEAEHMDTEVEALDAAIKAIETGGDLISRQAAINAVRVGILSAATIYGRSEEGMTARKEIESAINGLPSIDAIELGVEYSTIQFQVNLMADAEEFGNYRILNQRFVVERR